MSAVDPFSIDYVKFLAAMTRLQPKAFILENVPIWVDCKRAFCSANSALTCFKLK